MQAAESNAFKTSVILNMKIFVKCTGVSVLYEKRKSTEPVGIEGSLPTQLCSTYSVCLRA